MVEGSRIERGGRCAAAGAGDLHQSREPEPFALSERPQRRWKLVEPLIPPGKRGGGKRTVIMREMYILHRLSVAGDPERPAAALDVVKCREAIDRECSPTAAVIDSQSVKSADRNW
jgi:hypothetical protein